MAMRAIGSWTQHDYVRHVCAVAGFLGRSPETAMAEDVRRFQVHQREHGKIEAVLGAAVPALRFLFTLTLDRTDLSRRLELTPRPRKLPNVFSVDEVATLLAMAPGIKYRVALGLAYGAGLRVFDVAHRKADDTHDRRMLIRINEGTGPTLRHSTSAVSSWAGAGRLDQRLTITDPDQHELTALTSTMPSDIPVVHAPTAG